MDSTKTIHNISTKTVKQFAVAEEPNSHHRPYMEDTYFCQDSFMGHPKQALFAIFDGHGGKEASEFCSKNLSGLFKISLQSSSSVEAALLDLFSKMDEKINIQLKARQFGTTACIAFITFEQGEKVLYVANVGDTRALLGTNEKAERLSVDHKCTLEKEADRIRKSGGIIAFNRLGGSLAVSRSLGDFEMREMGLISVPNINRRVLRVVDKWLIIASDGIFDVIADCDAVSAIWKEDNSLNAAKKLVNMALQGGSMDNMCCVVIKL